MKLKIIALSLLLVFTANLNAQTANTPNKNLPIGVFQLLKAIKNNTELTGVQNSIAKYLPVYAVWVGLVAFLMPFIFNFK